MALSKIALQRKREKKKKKRQVKVSNLFSSTSSTMIDYHNWPIHECFVPTELWKCGIGQIIMSRTNNRGDIAVGIYLIDTYCLGIKDCFVYLTNAYEYQNMLENMRNSSGEMEIVEASYANTLITKAAEYANQFGFKPHSDFSKASRLLRGIPTNEEHEFSFGRDGKPLYIQGPNESPTEVRRILKTLESSKGAENCNSSSDT